MKRSLRILAPALVLALSASCACAQTIVGITEADELFTIGNVGAPYATTKPIAVTGITPGQHIAGLDYRPNTGELYALGYNDSSGAAQLYRINAGTAVATAVNATPITLALGKGSIGFDFNPTVDRIRVVGANGKNYRLNPINGSIAATDADLAYAPGDPNALASPSVGAIAYTNSYIGAEVTTLYDYEESLNILALQNPPNNGTLNTIGSSGVSVNPNNRTVDMDIYFDPVTRTNRAYLVANTGPGSIDGLFSVNPLTGAASLIGAIGLAVKDIAIAIDRSVPSLNDRLIYALTRINRNLVSFGANTPERIRNLVSITGVTAGQTIVGIDFRPADSRLYGLGYNPSNKQYQLYTINPDNGTAAAINGTSDSMNLGSDINAIGFDFNPAVDRIRVVSSGTRANYRLNPVTGGIAAIDSLLQWTVADPHVSLPVRIGSIAYTNSYKGATSSDLFGFSDTGSFFVFISPPNNGTLNTAFNTSIPVNSSDLSIDMDFFYDSVTKTNVGYLAANPIGNANDLLYTFSIGLSVTLGNTIGLGIQVADIAVKPAFTNASLDVKGAAAFVARPVVLPNPAADILQVSLPGAVDEEGRYQVSDITGRILLQGTLPAGTRQAEISLRGMASGIYFLNVGSKGSVYAPVQFTKL